MSKVETHVDESLAKLESQLNLWSSKLSAAGRQVKGDSRKQLDELKAKLAAARSKLDEAKAAGGDKWDTFKEGVEHTWQDIEGAFKKLVH